MIFKSLLQAFYPVAVRKIAIYTSVLSITYICNSYTTGTSALPDIYTQAELGKLLHESNILHIMYFYISIKAHGSVSCGPRSRRATP